MAFYEVSGRTTVVTATAGTPIASLKGVTRELYIREIHLFSATAPTTEGTLVIARSTALGTGALTSVVPNARDPGATAPTALLITAWGTAAPTLGTAATWFRRFTCGATIGSGIVWAFPEGNGLVVAGSAAATSELVLANAVALAPGTWDVTFVFEE